VEISIGEVSGAFQYSASQLSHAEIRQELEVQQIPAPANLAKEALAFSADILENNRHDHTDLGTGRFVLLHDLTPNEQWGGNYRIVAFAKSPLETFIGADEEVSEVAWAWLTEALANRGAEYSQEAGTITRVISTGFGSLAGKNGHAELEMRVSWSPSGNIGAHLEAWQDLVCMMSGYPLLPASVSPLHGPGSAARADKNAFSQVTTLR
jgi:hypothetical protein